MRRLSRNCDEDWLLKAGGIASGNNYTFQNGFLWIAAMIKKIKSRTGLPVTTEVINLPILDAKNLQDT